MGIVKELLDTIRTMGALEKRTEDVLRNVTALTAKVDLLADRMTRLELEQQHLRESVRNEILADLKADLAQTKLLLDLQAAQQRAPRISSDG